MLKLLLAILLLLKLVASQILDDLNLNYNTLRSNNNGRHFLVTTLLEKLYQPLEVPRFQGKVTFVLPKTLGGDGRGKGECCVLQDVPFKYRKGHITKAEIVKVLRKKVKIYV